MATSRRATGSTDGAGAGPLRAADESGNRAFLIGLARAFGGAIFFSLPLLMTMEMWFLGFYMDGVRLALFVLFMIPMLIGLAHYGGFRETATWSQDAADGLTACGVGLVASAAILLLFNVIDLGMPAREIVGKVALQAVPAGFGAVLASSQLGDDTERDSPEEARKRNAGYGGELFFMAAGATFFAFNVAPTEEMILIAFKLTPWRAVALIATSLLLMHAFVYAVEFRGTRAAPEGIPWWSLFLRYTVVGYAISILISVYVLWTFGRWQDTALPMFVLTALVLAFPASIGAAAARLIL